MRYLKLELLDYWHAGTGRGEGAYLDALVIKRDELPYLPGKTVKGLLREATLTAEEAGRCDTGTTLRLFGRPDGAYDAGGLIVDDATLPQGVVAWLSTSTDGAALRKHLYRAVASTRIDEDGLARDKNLRRIEVTVPVTLYAPLSCNGPSESWVQILERVAPLIRSLGSHRRRGLGRVRTSVVHQEGHA